MELKREAEYCDVLFPFTDGTSLSKNRRQVFSAAGDFVLESLTVSLGAAREAAELAGSEWRWQPLPPAFWPAQQGLVTSLPALTPPSFLRPGKQAAAAHEPYLGTRSYTSDFDG